MSSFDSNGNYNKTNWKTGDKITADKLNKIEESLEIINNNDIERHKEVEGDLEGLHAKDEELSAQLAHIAQQNVIRYKNLVKDGDWSYAIQEAIDNVEDKGVVYLPQVCTIKKTIKVNKQISFIGNGHSKIICDYSNWGGHEFGDSVPQTTALFIEGREPILNSHLEDINLNIGGFVLEAINTENKDTYGMYLGYADISNITQATTINYCNMGKSFKNISVLKFNTGIELGEVWDCVFEDIILRGNTLHGIIVKGQSVNNFFKNCRVYGGDVSLYVTSKIYPNGLARPEGNIFDGGFYGSGKVGIKHEDGLFCNYTNLVVDLNEQYAIEITSGDSVCISNCYLYSNGDYTVKLNNTSATDNNISTSFTDNKFIGTEHNIYAIGDAGNWTGLIIKGNSFMSYKSSGCIMLGYYNRSIVTNNVFKGNTVNQCIVCTNLTELSEFNNFTNDNNLVVLCRDGSVSTKINSDININKFSIINGNSNINLKDDCFNINIPNIRNFKINNSYFLASIYLTDCNEIPLINCFIYATGTTTNKPAAGIWLGEQILIDKNYICQTLYNNIGHQARRFRINEEWSDWKIVDNQ